MRKILKMNQPKISCYTVYGALFSIIEEQAWPWVYSNFIQLMYHKDWQMLAFEDHDGLLENCPFLRIESINLCDCNSQEVFVNQICSFINSNYYLYLFLDWKVLFPELIVKNLAHNTVISGYDEAKNVFFLSDNYIKNKFATITIDMSIVYKAFLSAKSASVGNTYDNDGTSNFDYLSRISAYKYLSNISSKINKDDILNKIKSYLFSYSNSPIKDNNCYGLNVYKLLIDSLQQKNDYPLSIRDLHMLYEHKALMENRISYLQESKIIENGLLDEAHKLTSISLFLQSVYLKSLMKSFKAKNLYIQTATQPVEIDLDTINEMICALNKMLVLDENLMNKFAKHLQA